MFIVKRISCLALTLFLFFSCCPVAHAATEIDPAWTLVADLLSHYGEGDLRLGEGRQAPVSDAQMEKLSLVYDMKQYNVIVAFNINKGNILSLGKKDDGSWQLIQWSDLSESVIRKNSLRIAKNYKSLSSWSKGLVMLHVQDDSHSMFIYSADIATKYVETETIEDNTIESSDTSKDEAASTDTSSDPIPFESSLVDGADFTAKQWFSTDYSRATFTIMLIYELSVRENLSLTDYSIAESVVGMTSDGILSVAICGTKDTLLIFYIPSNTQNKAQYMKMSKVDFSDLYSLMKTQNDETYINDTASLQKALEQLQGN